MDRRIVTHPPFDARYLVGLAYKAAKAIIGEGDRPRPIALVARKDKIDMGGPLPLIAGDGGLDVTAIREICADCTVQAYAIACLAWAVDSTDDSEPRHELLIVAQDRDQKTFAASADLKKINGKHKLGPCKIGEDEFTGAISNLFVPINTVQ